MQFNMWLDFTCSSRPMSSGNFLLDFIAAVLSNSNIFLMPLLQGYFLYLIRYSILWPPNRMLMNRLLLMSLSWLFSRPWLSYRMLPRKYPMTVNELGWIGALFNLFRDSSMFRFHDSFSRWREKIGMIQYRNMWWNIACYRKNSCMLCVMKIAAICRHGLIYVKQVISCGITVVVSKFVLF